tara:strand:+ start:941 stop:1132 length:192 start_codon:yes stop_codon:yes gene_type:complete
MDKSIINDITFKELFNNYIWGDMKLKFGAAIYGRYDIEYNIEYYRYEKCKNITEYINNGSWLK